MSNLGNRLRHYRKKAGLSIYDVEDQTGRHFTTISKYERGERQPKVEVVRELAEVYDVSPARLITEISDVEDILPDEVILAARIVQKRSDIAEIMVELESLAPEQVQALKKFLLSLQSCD